MIQVNKPYLPTKEKYIRYLDSIWKNNHLTNFGPLSILLEERLCEYLEVDNLLLVSNGTIALQVAYKLLGLQKDDKIITTPFSFVATTNTLIWEGLHPQFVDIDAESFCINVEKIESLFDSNQNTNFKAILPVHVFGNACEVEKLELIAKKYNLALIYDAAHAFGVRYKNTSIFSYGDISTISFHATKLFHSVEGGAIVFKDNSLKNEAKKIINFGLRKSFPETLGINAKNSEFHAAMGLCVLEDMPYIMEEREKIWTCYENKLKNYFTLQKRNLFSTNNFHYFPILFEKEKILLATIDKLHQNGIYPRRYFYPSLEVLSFVNSTKCQISQNIANRILCLPIYVGLREDEQDKIIEILKSQ